MGPGVVLLGIAALAGVFALRNITHRRSAVDRRLAALGFKPCEAEAPALERAWRALTGCDASQQLQVVRCSGRIAGRGMMHHFTVREKAVRGPTDTSNPAASYPAYLFDLRNAGSVARGAVTLHVQPPKAKMTRKALPGAIDLNDNRPTLEIGSHPWSPSIVAAHGKTGGRLDDVVPADVQEKLVRAAAHGFCVIHLGNGKAAFATFANDRDVERQIAYLAEWL